MNLKKLANWIWRDTFGLVRRTPILMNFHIFYLYIIKMVPFILVIGTICLQTVILYNVVKFVIVIKYKIESQKR